MNLGTININTLIITRIYAFIFVEYFKVVENALATYSPECVSQIKQANQMIDSQIKTTKGAKLIEKKFK